MHGPAMADVTGTILVTVTDPSSAAVPGVKVTLNTADTGLTRTTTTDTKGSYELLAVPVGEDYMLGVELKGFRRSVQSGTHRSNGFDASVLGETTKEES
ncbi:MAG: hypothetical protein DMG08_30565 [Acidobacteria bacterium]|nr:MAG: hypothetical protein DMG08_30565 [Acidobacteriota bacterium]PYV01527.1 MAG: hypothetical protein DMG10_17445 [Acidobacteriota bacterium]